MKSITFEADRFNQPTTTAPHELADAVNRIELTGIFTEEYGYTYWLKQVSACHFDHPLEEIEKLLKKMHDLSGWLLRERRGVMSRGAWLTNRLKELRLAQQAIPRSSSEDPQ